MKKTLILAVDRDDDFGNKGGVVSPVIGFDNCLKAAEALAIADPEDSDSNALFGALHEYRDMENDPEEEDFEVALICGYKSVGRKADDALLNQLREVCDQVHPDRVLLVVDGAEDADVSNNISHIVPVFSVKKIFVKQAPNVESLFYFIKRSIEDPEKRRRFLTPLSWIIMIVSGIYILSSLFTSGSINAFVSKATTPFIFFTIGFILAFYSYNVERRIAAFIESWKNRAARGSIMTVFFAASLALCVVGVVVGFYSISEVYVERESQMVLIFMVYSLWFFIFAFMVYAFGAVVDSYLNSRVIRFSFIAPILMLVSMGLVVNGILDYMMDYVGLYSSQPIKYAMEIAVGFALAVSSVVLHNRIKKNYGKKDRPEVVPNDVQ